MHKRPHTMEEVDPDEVKLAEIRKHPFGIIAVYIQAALGLLLAFGLCFFLIPAVLVDKNTAFLIAGLAAFIAATITLVLIIMASFIYKENKLIVTDRNITQTLQIGIFNRKTSQLNIANVEDVTARQKGLLASMFNFGMLEIETAGEQSNFHFPFCPDPDHYAKLILDAREKMLGQMDESVFRGKHVAGEIPHREGIAQEQDSRSSVHDKSEAVAIKEKPKTTRKPIAESIKDIGSETIRHAGSNVEDFRK